MSILTIKLTNTAPGNTAIDPENSHICDEIFALMGYLEELQRNTGDHDGILLGTITMVESFCHGRSASLTQYTITSGLGEDEDVSLGDADDAIQYFDITGIRAWAWVDFANILLHVYVAWGDPANDLEVPCIGFRVTYTPTPGARRGTSGFLALIHSAVSFR